jgi:glyoxylase-like metal-dependent hydrolase (beta-lactamase superfamily II)
MMEARGVMTKTYAILHPAIFKLDGGAMFGIIPKPLWSKFIPADDLNRIQLSLRVMLIQTKNRNILVDTGIGDYHGDKFEDRFGVIGPKNPLVESLKKNMNLGPEDITDLIVTHLHFDHVGGLGHAKEDHSTIFPSATLHIHRQHYDYALNPTLRDSGSFHSQYFRPLIEKARKDGQIHWLEGEEGLILDDEGDKIFFKCSHGHTPYLVHPYDDKFIYMADLVPTSAHIPVPWVMGYDIAPGITTTNKVNFYQFILDKNLTMIFEHDMKVWGAKIKKKTESDFEADITYPVTSLDPLKPEIIFA